MSDLPKEQNEDLFDFPPVEGFSPEFIEAARLQTEAANGTTPETGGSFDDPARPQGADTDEDLDYEGFDDEFADDFADLMGDSLEETPEEAPVEEPVVAAATTESGFNSRVVWGALTLLIAGNLLWGWTWYASEGRLRGEMDQRFQGYLAQQRAQLDEAVSTFTPSEGSGESAQGHSSVLGTPADASSRALDEIKRDLMHSRYDTARAKAWRLIARVDALPKEHRASTEAAVRLLIAESYEIQGTDSQENEG